MRQTPGVCPAPGGKKPSASQQEISNHFSDTKATGMRCRSAEEELQRGQQRNGFVYVGRRRRSLASPQGPQEGQPDVGLLGRDLDSLMLHSGGLEDQAWRFGVWEGAGTEAGRASVPQTCAIDRF